MFDTSSYTTSTNIMTRTPEADARRYQAIEEHLFSQVSDEGVILSLKNGKYYGVNSVGVCVWKNIQQAATLEEIEAAVMKEYDVDPETCHREVTVFLEEMLGEELIDTFNEPRA